MAGQDKNTEVLTETHREKTTQGWTRGLIVEREKTRDGRI